MRALVLVALAACWTGPVVDDPVPSSVRPKQAPLALEVTLERSPCMGTCPAYKVLVRGDGSVVWTGIANVVAMGTRAGHVTRKQLLDLDRALTAIRFFELDDQGNLPAPRTFKFSMCTDTSHAIITAKRGTQLRRIDDPQCGDDLPVESLEVLVDRIANTARWVGAQ